MKLVKPHMKIQKASEDYLESMLMMKEQHGYIRSVDVADHLGVTKPSVTYATKRLRENGYIEMDRDGLITLTDRGMAIAAKMLDRHHTLTKFLIALGVDEKTAEEDACKIEHDISQQTYDAICEHASWSYQWDAENGLRIDTTTAPARLPTDPDTGDAALDKALTILNNSYLAGGKYHGMLEGGGKKTSFDATLDVSSTPDVTTVKFTAEPFPFFDNGVSFFANYYAVKGGFASDEQIGISGNSPELGDVGYPIYAEVAVWAENSYIGKCFLDCQFTGARSKHITDAKRVSSSGSTETWELTVTFASDGFTGYTASVSVDTAKSAVTQIVIRTANYTLTMTPA